MTSFLETILTPNENGKNDHDTQEECNYDYNMRQRWILPLKHWFDAGDLHDWIIIVGFSIRSLLPTLIQKVLVW